MCYGAVWNDSNLTTKYSSFDLFIPLDRDGTFTAATMPLVTYSTNELMGIFAYADRAGLKNVCKGVQKVPLQRDHYSGKLTYPEDCLVIHVPTKGQKGIAIRTLFNIVRTTCEYGVHEVGKHFLRFCEEGGPEPILNKLLVAHYAATGGGHHCMRPTTNGLFELHTDAWYATHILRGRKKSSVTTDYFPFRFVKCDCGYPVKYDPDKYNACPAHGINTFVGLRTAILEGKPYDDVKALYLKALDERTEPIVKPRKVKA